ncbi:MAG: helix-turn-helix domain-containing protein [Candidatus Natronoplasma sp.]
MTGLNERIAGEITLSEKPGEIIRKWREMFDVSQVQLAKEMDISSSVISDYEKGRRKPGTPLVRKIVHSLVDIDKTRGGEVIDRFTKPGQEGILSKDEFTELVTLEDLLQDIEGEMISEVGRKRDIYGYTVIDSMKAILSMKSFDYLSIYGWSTERILFFKGVEHGRSPLVAIRSTPLSPAAVCYIKPEKIDDLSKKLAKVESIPLASTDLDTDELIKKMKKWL